MADFVIKSAAGTGNKTLIQGQDQSGSNYAIEIGDAGALKLGTITAGTYKGTIHSDTTFPAGYISATTIHTAGSSTETASSSDVEALTVDYNMTDDSAKLVVIGLGYIQRGSADGSIRVSLKLDGTQVSFHASLNCKDNDGLPIPSWTQAGYSGSKTWSVDIRSNGSNKCIFKVGSGLIFMEVKQ